MPFRLDRLVPCGSHDDRLIWYYQNLEDPASVMTEAGYFPKSLEVERIVAAQRGVTLVCKTELSLVRRFMDRIADEVLDD